MPDLPQLAPETTAALGHLQCLADAIAYRTARLAAPCPDCPAGGRCDDHAGDEHLAAAYQRRQAAALATFLERYDPADVGAIMTGSEETPAMDLAGAVALNALYRDLAADGPFITTRNGQHVMIELDGGRLLEHPVDTGGGG